jgi:hypothetical protein
MRTVRSGGWRSLWTSALAALLGVVPALAGDVDAAARPAERVDWVSASGSGGVVSAAHRDARRSSRVHRRPHATRHGIYLGWGPYWGATWGGYWSGYWDPYWYGPRFGYTTVYPRAGETYGALDTDLSPERAEVWIDGRKIGVADDFDGFPSYLWLERGTYDVVFYLPGFKTIARQYSIYPGLVIDVEDRMERGEAVHPLDLVPASHERRDERLRRDRERRAEAESGAWREERVADERGEPWLDARSEPGKLRVAVAPGDASVYLDGRFVGTGDDLARLRAGMLVDTGRHTLEIVRPGYRSVQREVEVARGEEAVLRIELEPEGGAQP